MKLLILCDMFPPAFGPRMGYLCKYLKRAGWELTVVTEHIDDNTFAFLTGYAGVSYIHYYKAKGKIFRKLEWLCVFLMDFFFHYKDRKMAKVAARLLDKEPFDGLLCSTYRTFPLPAARKLAEKFDLPFVADLRDIIEQYASHEYISSFKKETRLNKGIIRLFRRKLLKDRNRALSVADRITTISPWHVEILKQYNPHVELIYNGYDPDLFFPEKDIVTPQFCITYSGRLISLATRDPGLLFEAVAKLAKEERVSEETFRIKWYIDDASREMILPLVRQYGISRYMEYPGYVPAKEIPGILNRSSILLQLANKTEASGPKGFMTTKLFEYFAVEKPVLCVRSDESYMEEAIRKTETGIAARTVKEVYDFILHHYSEWEKQGYTAIRPNREAIESFSRKKQAEQFIRIFTELTEKK